MDDIKPGDLPATNRMAALPHIHKWFLAQRATEFQQVNPGNAKLHEKIEWAYLICQGCATVSKTKIEELEK